MTTQTNAATAEKSVTLMPHEKEPKWFPPLGWRLGMDLPSDYPLPPPHIQAIHRPQYAKIQQQRKHAYNRRWLIKWGNELKAKIKAKEAKAAINVQRMWRGKVGRKIMRKVRLKVGRKHSLLSCFNDAYEKDVPGTRSTLAEDGRLWLRKIFSIEN